MSMLIPLMPLLVVGLGGFVLMLVDAFSDDTSELATLSSVILLAAAAVAGVLASGQAGSYAAPEIIAPYLSVSPMSQFLNATICTGAGMSALLAGGYLHEHALDRGEFYALIVLSAFGAMVLASATDLLSIFIGLETMSLGVYSMVAFRRGSPRSAEAGLKYFLLGSFAAAIFLFGAALLYGASGHTNLESIGKALAGGILYPRVLVLGMLLLIIGIAFKVSAVPFHMWTPDAYEGAVTPATTFMSVVVKAAAFAVLVRLLLACFGSPATANLVTGWPMVVSALAAVTMIIGNLGAATQSSVKRMLAYSSIAHAGYILVGVVVLASTDADVRATAVSSILFYLAAYTVSNVLAFGSLIAMGSYGKEAVSYDDLAGAGRRHPLAALPFVIGVLSLMGFPPTAGFLGKWYVFSAAVAFGDSLLWLVILGVLTSVIGAYYYLRVIVYMFMKAPETGAAVAQPMRSGYVVLALVVSCYFVLKMGITPARYIDVALHAAGKLG